MTLRVLIPTGRWKVHADSANDCNTIRLSGRAFTDGWKSEPEVQAIVLTHDQAQELISALNTTLRELELQRTASLARAAEGEGVAEAWDYALSRS